MHSSRFFLLSLTFLSLSSLSAGMQEAKNQAVEGRSLKVDIFGDWLYWTAFEESLEFAYDGVANAPPVTASVSDGTKGVVYFPQRSWESGFKVGLDVHSPVNGLSVFSEYTWFRNSANSRVNKGNSDLRKLWNTINYNTVTVASASGSWNLVFDVVDLGVAKKVLIGKNLILNPFLAMKGTWQEQGYRVAYTGAFSGLSSTSMHQSIHYYGVGPRFGLGVDWRLGCPLHIISSVSLSMLWERFHTERIDTNYGQAEYVSLVNERHITTLNPVVEASLGLEYEVPFWRNKYCFNISAAYEYQVWFHQNQFSKECVDSNGVMGNLTLQGLTLRGTFQF